LGEGTDPRSESLPGFPTLDRMASRIRLEVNTAVDDFYIRQGLGAGSAVRIEIPGAAPRALGTRKAGNPVTLLLVSSGPRTHASHTLSRSPCKASVDLFGLEKNDFIPQVQDIITVGEFYTLAAGGQIIFT
jgi:hypothetical protein